MEILTRRDIMSRTGKSERTVQYWIAQVKEKGSYTVEIGDSKWLMKDTGQKNERREKLYSWEQIDGPVAEVVVEEEAAAEVHEEEKHPEPQRELSFNELNDLRNAHTATPSQLALWIKAAIDGGYAGYKEDKVTKRWVLDSPDEQILVPSRVVAMKAEVDQKLIDLDEREAELKRKEKSWEDDNAMLEAQKAELNEQEKDLAEREEKLYKERVDLRTVALVKKWAGETVNALMNSEAWWKAFQAEKVEIPDWPLELDENLIASWAKLPIPEEEQATPGKQPKKKKKQVKAKKQTVDVHMFDES